MRSDVRLQIKCAMPEKLIQRAAESGARMSRVRMPDRHTLRIDCDEASAAILTGLCKAYRLNLRVLESRGPRTLLRRAKKRWSLLAALIAAVCICGFALNRVWKIEIAFTGPCANLGGETAILDCVRTAGIAVGMRRGEINADTLCKRIAADAGDFSYVGAHLQGVCLRIEAAPETPAPEVYHSAAANDLTAARSGIVEAVFVESGSACVKIGDTVRIGQTLIRGDERGSGDMSAPIRARGQVLARCWYESTATAPLEKTVSERTGRTRVEAQLRCFDQTLPIRECEPFASEETASERLPVTGMLLPLEVCRTVHAETAVKTVPVDKGELETRLTALARAGVLRTLTAENKTFEIASEWTDVEIIDHEMRVRVVIEAIADIAAAR